jgi:ribonuclease G
MYNDDDAVAKLDGYVVSVSGAAPLVGDKTLVRIEKVGRSAALGSLVDPPEGLVASARAEEQQPSGNGRRRRRGRRGGRGRRRAGSSAGSG